MRTRSIPFGYEVVGGRYVVNNGEAEIISSIYNMYLSGKTLLGIAEVLTEQETTYFEDTKVMFVMTQSELKKTSFKQQFVNVFLL